MFRASQLNRLTRKRFIIYVTPSFSKRRFISSRLTGFSAPPLGNQGKIVQVFHGF